LAAHVRLSDFRLQTSDFRLQSSFLLTRPFGHDADLEVRRDVAMELHRDGVLAELLDRLRKLQLAASSSKPLAASASAMSPLVTEP